MISASEAKRQTEINSRCKEYLDKLESEINEASNKGLSSATMIIFQLSNFKEIESIIRDELIRLGYTVNIRYPKPLPSGCRSDQWDFNAYISVSW